MSRCALPNVAITQYATPLGALPLDNEIISKLRCSGHFDELSVEDDENEHSLEMQLPFLRHITKGVDIKIVPIVVGHVASRDIDRYSSLLSTFFNDPRILFVISSDFAHWGSRFGYTYLPASEMCFSVNESIKNLDSEAIEAIANIDAKKFSRHLQHTGNTICGQTPIKIYLQLAETSGKELQSQLLAYSQSTRKASLRDGCVSYAAIGAWVC